MSANLFITNGASGNLGQRLHELISASREMRALVGFFYFSGVKVLYDALRANPTISRCACWWAWRRRSTPANSRN